MATVKTALVGPTEPIEQNVRNGFCLSHFIKPHFERDKEDHAFVAFEVSFPLTEEHAAKSKSHPLPEKIYDAWDAVQEHGFKRVDILGVELQNVELMLVPDSADSGLKITGAEIEKASISSVLEKGIGEEKEVIRLHFRIKTELDKETGRFASTHFGHQVWVRMRNQQGRLIER